jgi:hypothetical protein
MGIISCVGNTHPRYNDECQNPDALAVAGACLELP